MLNWHLDSFAAQLPTLKLEKLGVFDDEPFSINLTTGPYVVSIGDGKGWNLDNNLVAQNILQRFAAKGHALGSHGGWNHDYCGLNAGDTNRITFLPYLKKHKLNQTSGQPPVAAFFGVHNIDTQGYCDV